MLREWRAWISLGSNGEAEEEGVVVGGPGEEVGEGVGEIVGFVEVVAAEVAVVA